jgi:hypothetical protein
MVVNGWKVFVHPLFSDQLIHLIEQVEALAKQKPTAYKEEARPSCWQRSIDLSGKSFLAIQPPQSFAKATLSRKTIGIGSVPNFTNAIVCFIASLAKRKSSSTLGLTMRRPFARRDRQQTLTAFSRDAGSWRSICFDCRLVAAIKGSEIWSQVGQRWMPHAKLVPPQAG